jgi:hypothetical protein
VLESIGGAVAHIENVIEVSAFPSPLKWASVVSWPELGARKKKGCVGTEKYAHRKNTKLWRMCSLLCIREFRLNIL